MNKLYFFLLVIFLFSRCTKNSDITGELKKWHKVVLTFNGPECSEMGEINPFTDYRLDVIFSHKEKKYTVPGFFAADGKAEYTSASEGNKWRAIFTPDEVGEWTYLVSFKKGKNISLNEEEGESGGFMDGKTGTFLVEVTDKTGRDFRAHGRLQYVGEHYLQAAETGKYFLKCGADAPENLLAYYEFDYTPNVGERLKKWEDHAQDYNPDADLFLWGENKDKGKNLLGAINYLSKKGMNAFSFLTFNIDGDDRNVFPHLLKIDLEEYKSAASEKEDTNQWVTNVIHNRFDVSKLAQWEKVFSYGEMKGMFLHFKTLERENCLKMDDGDLGPSRKIYYRELIARFGHHLALNWNISEESRLSSEQHKEIAKYFHNHDSYQNIVVLHSWPGEEHWEKIYRPLLGKNSFLNGISFQTYKPSFSEVHENILHWVTESAKAAKKWVVSLDEPGDARDALLTDAENPTHDSARINALWGTLLAGGAGTEWYFGYKHPHSDLTCESWRSRDLFWDQGRIALEFFVKNNIPFWEMQNMNDITPSTNDFVFAKEGEVYLIYKKSGGEIYLSLPEIDYNMNWFNPRTGEMTNITSKTETANNNFVTPTNEDWLLYISK